MMALVVLHRIVQSRTRCLYIFYFASCGDAGVLDSPCYCFIVSSVSMLDTPIDTQIAFWLAYGAGDALYMDINP